MLKRPFEAAVRIEKKMQVLDRLAAKSVIFAVKHPVITLGGGLVLKEVLFGHSPRKGVGGSRNISQVDTENRASVIEGPVERTGFAIERPADPTEDTGHFTVAEPEYQHSEVQS